MPRISFFSIGCKLNSYEIDMLRVQFARAGYDIVPFGHETDITVINTCTVTERADADCRKMVRRAYRDGARPMIVVTGCMAQQMADSLDGMPEVRLVVGNTSKTSLLDYVEDARSERSTARVIPGSETDAPAFLSIDRVEEASEQQSHTRAMLQVQDGCDERCTYCIIPSVRGASRSRPVSAIVAHSERIVDAGYREIALTGVNTGAWGEDLRGRERFIDVLRAVCGVPGVERIRINSIEPNTIDNELIDFLVTEPRICRHYHIPLQSGADRVLKRMNRRYSSDDYALIVNELAVRQPDAAIGADVMVAFPGETEEEFAETYDLIERLPVTYLHVFPYSQRDGTPAMNLPAHHTRAVKDSRSSILRALGQEKRDGFHSRHIKTTVSVLIEDSRDTSTGFLRGLTDNYIRVTVDSADGNLINQIVPVRLVSTTRNGANGELVREHADLAHAASTQEEASA
jgi:threonylcarbamoyladenosine tRNA methylthiotransferase MtaB